MQNGARFRRSSMLRDDCRPAVVLVSNTNGQTNEEKRTTATATAPPANGVDDVNHADASGTAATNKDSCLITVRTPSNDVGVLACTRDDVVSETESARATPPRVAHRCNAAPSYSPFKYVPLRNYSLILYRIRTLSDHIECCTERQVNFDTGRCEDDEMNIMAMKQAYVHVVLLQTRAPQHI
jgi:hypothetical protein